MQLSGETEEDRTLWCGNLHEDVTEEILFELFLQAGPLSKVKIIGAKEGRPPYAFITFEHCVSVAFAKELMSGIKLYGKPIKLQLRNKAQCATAELRLQEHKQFNDSLKCTFLTSESVRLQQRFGALSQNYMPFHQAFNHQTFNLWNPQNIVNFNQQQWNSFTANTAQNFQNLLHFSGSFK